MSRSRPARGVGAGRAAISRPLFSAQRDVPPPAPEQGRGATKQLSQALARHLVSNYQSRSGHASPRLARAAPRKPASGQARDALPAPGSMAGNLGALVPRG